MKFKMNAPCVAVFFSFFTACVTPEPTRHVCRDDGLLNISEIDQFVFSPNIKAGAAPKSATEYNRLVQSGTTDFLLLGEKGSLLEVTQTKRNLLALGYGEEDIKAGNFGFSSENEEASCISTLNTLNALLAFKNSTDRRLFISTRNASRDLPLLGVLYDRFIEEKNFIASYKNRLCDRSKLSCVNLDKSQALYRVAKTMELTSPALWLRNPTEFCSNLKALDESDVKFVNRYLTCESNELSAMTR